MRRKPLYTLPPPRYCRAYLRYTTALSQPRYVLKSARILEKCFAALHSTPRHATTVLTYGVLCHCLKSTPLCSKKVLAF